MFFLFMLVCLLGVLSKSTHMLSFLISLEFLGLFILFIFAFLFAGVTSLLISFLFMLGALGCESVLGLVMFVVLSRSFGKDYLGQLFLLKF